MAWYSFTGKNSLGHRIQGRYHIRNDVNSELALMSRLHSAGVTAVSINKISFFRVCLIKLTGFASRFFPISKSNLSLFYYQLADMLEAGVPLKNALLIIANHLSNPRFIQIIRDVAASLAKGYTFSDALSKHERLFSLVTVRLVSFAQSKEELTAMLRYCDQSMQRSTFLKKLLLVVMPQLSITIVFFMILLFLRIRYLPSFNYAIFVFKNPVPLVIHIFDFITSMFTVNILKTIGMGFIVFFGCKLLVYFSKKVRFFYHAFLCYFPVVSGVILAVERERLSLLYSVLLKGGASTQKCAQYSAAVINNLFFQRRVKAMSLAVQQGDSFSGALRFFRLFNSAEVQMIALGALSNSLVKTFERIYSVSQVVLEKKLLLLIEFVRFSLYILNTTLFFFAIFVTETLFYYPGAH